MLGSEIRHFLVISQHAVIIGYFMYHWREFESCTG